MTRVAVLIHHIGPYHHARLNSAAEKLDVVGLEWSSMGTYAWGKSTGDRHYDKSTLLCNSESSYCSKSRQFALLSASLLKYRPDAVAVNGWGDFGARVAIWACVNHKIPIVMMSESTSHDVPRIRWQEFVKRRLLSCASAALVGGQTHVTYLKKLGFPEERVFTGYDVVDNHFFSTSASEARSKSRPSFLPSSRYFLASSRFIPRKNLLTLIQAYRIYFQRHGTAAWKLIILGDGEQRQELEQQIAREGIKGFVDMPGFRPYSELPQYYGWADVFVHAPTSEQWGLVVNEAMASGLPVIVSDRCGCARDLVQNTENGYTFNPHDAQELANIMELMASSSTCLSDMGKSSQRIIERWSPVTFADGMHNAVTTAISYPRIRPNSFTYNFSRLLAYG